MLDDGSIDSVVVGGPPGQGKLLAREIHLAMRACRQRLIVREKSRVLEVEMEVVDQEPIEICLLLKLSQMGDKELPTCIDVWMFL